jgi:polyhydroxyalkanoate synthase
MQLFGGPVRYVYGGSGHIAGVVNPPALGKYEYWTGDAPDKPFDEWLASATETKGSWWPDWFAWINAQAPTRVMARVPGSGALPVLGDAPGDYVRVKG